MATVGVKGLMRLSVELRGFNVPLNRLLSFWSYLHAIGPKHSAFASNHLVGWMILTKQNITTSNNNTRKLINYARNNGYMHKIHK